MDLNALKAKNYYQITYEDEYFFEYRLHKSNFDKFVEYLREQFPRYFELPASVPLQKPQQAVCLQARKKMTENCRDIERELHE